MSIYGMRVYIDDQLGWNQKTEQVRFPRSKKKRMRNKWKKNAKNFKTTRWQVPEYYLMGDRVIVNSVGFAQLKAKAQR